MGIAMCSLNSSANGSLSSFALQVSNEPTTRARRSLVTSLYRVFLEEQRCDLSPAVMSSQSKRCHALVVLGLVVGAGLQKQLHYPRESALCRYSQGRSTVVISMINIGAKRKKEEQDSLTPATHYLV